jgi:hypothetical protein
MILFLLDATRQRSRGSVDSAHHGNSARRRLPALRHSHFKRPRRQNLSHSLAQRWKSHLFVDNNSISCIRNECQRNYSCLFNNYYITADTVGQRSRLSSQGLGGHELNLNNAHYFDAERSSHSERCTVHHVTLILVPLTLLIASQL